MQSEAVHRSQSYSMRLSVSLEGIVQASSTLDLEIHFPAEISSNLD